MYFEELFDLKKKQIELGESEKGTMDLMGNFKTSSPFSQSNESRSHDKSKLRILPRRFQDRNLASRYTK